MFLTRKSVTNIFYLPIVSKTLQLTDFKDHTLLIMWIGSSVETYNNSLSSGLNGVTYSQQGTGHAPGGTLSNYVA
jgi:hypothetical protein